MAVLITPDGNKIPVVPANKEFTLKEMYSLLSCSMVEVICLENGLFMWIDEEGKFKPHYVNPEATTMFHASGGMADDYIAGSALITERSEVR
ncbi:MAG: DUF3846 domain-containing protein [Proteobacteria bacterium]|nr:DUF3846 domain-containing protein [Pseudomonadota bacterium]